MTGMIRPNQPKNYLAIYGVCHLRAAFSSLGRIMRTPLVSFLTIAVIGITLALPTSFYVILENMHQLSQQWSNNNSQISLYLKNDISNYQARDLLQQLRNNSQIAKVVYISPQQGLNEFTKSLGLDNAVSALQNNPIPGVIVVQPINSLNTPEEVQFLVNTLKQLPEVSVVQLDMQWLQRFHNIVDLVQHVVTALTILLAIGVLLIVGNTIRLATQNERREISVLKLVGATNAFIRRPFLYSGIWYGLFGGLVAWAIVALIVFWLQDPAAKLASSYSSNFYLQGLSNSDGFHLLLASILLGLVGSWFAVSRSLAK
jgi:cell division transport system permease protein